MAVVTELKPQTFQPKSYHFGGLRRINQKRITIGDDFNEDFFLAVFAGPKKQSLPRPIHHVAVSPHDTLKCFPTNLKAGQTIFIDLFEISEKTDGDKKNTLPTNKELNGFTFGRKSTKIGALGLIYLFYEHPDFFPRQNKSARNSVATAIYEPTDLNRHNLLGIGNVEGEDHDDQDLIVEGTNYYGTFNHYSKGDSIIVAYEHPPL